MGNNRILEARNHLVNLLLQAESLEQAEKVRAMAEAIEMLLQCEHMAFASDNFKLLKNDFPTEIDFE